MGKIFISYRRKDWSFAERLREHIESRLPHSTVFIDSKIGAGEFPPTIRSEISNCDVFLLIVSEWTFERSRIDVDTDWIRQEINEAIHHKKPMAIAAIDEVKIPKDLPSDIKLIADINATKFISQRYDDWVSDLIHQFKMLAPNSFELDTLHTGIHPLKKVTVEQTGIEATYDNLDQCSHAMKEDFKASDDIRLLVQLGRKEFGDSKSFFYELAKEKRHSNCEIRILRPSASSPFLSEQRAMKRAQKRGITWESQFEEWREAINNLETHISRLKNGYSVNIQEREHTEPFLWRIFMFNDVAYVSGYLFSRKNDEKAVVHKIVKGANSLFSVFDKYFEFLWIKCDPSDGRWPNEKWSDWDINE